MKIFIMNFVIQIAKLTIVTLLIGLLSILNCSDDSLCEDSTTYKGNVRISDGQCIWDDGCEVDEDTPKYYSLDELKGCEEITGNLIIYDNSIRNLNALSSLKKVGSNFKIGLYDDGIDAPNKRLEDISGLSNLHSIGCDLEIQNNYKLKNLNGLENLKTIGNNVIIVENYSLISIKGLSGLTNIPGDFDIGYLDINSIPDLIKLTKIGGELAIFENEELSNIGLINLISTTGIYISNNPSVVNVKFNNLEKVETINIFKMNNLKTIEFSNLSNPIITNIKISETVIENLNGLYKIQKIKDDLQIYRNNLLINLSGLFNIIHVGNFFDIYENISLTDEKAWELVNYIGEENIGDIYIKNNYQ